MLVREGRHDVFNDLNHRSVAAETVRFLEWLRAGTRSPALSWDDDDLLDNVAPTRIAP